MKKIHPVIERGLEEEDKTHNSGRKLEDDDDEHKRCDD